MCWAARSRCTPTRWTRRWRCRREQAARIALRTQQVIANETNVAHVADPLGGSWFVEALTDEMERQAEEMFAHLDELGEGSMLEGAIRGIEENWFQGEIAESAYELERRFNPGRRIVVGVNGFTEGNDEARRHLADHQRGRGTPSEAARTRSRQDRDEAAVDAALARSEPKPPNPDVNLMPILIDAVNAYATLGEIMATLAGVFGRHVEVPTI